MGIKYTPAASSGDITSVTAGVGLSGGNTSGDVTVTFDISELSTVTPANGDFFATLDSDGSTEQKTTTTALATLLAGTGLTASSAVIGVDAAQTQITSVGDLATGTIASGFGVIDNGTSGIRTNTFTAETSIVPDAASGATLGTTSLEWGHLYIGDDQKVYLGDGQDVSLEYDEDGTDQLRVSGATVFEDDMEIADSKFIEFASAAGTPTTDDKVQGIVIEFLASEAITAFDAVYVSTTTGRVGRANATAAGTMPAIGIAIEAQGSAGSSVRVLTHGVYRDDGGFGGNLTIGNEVYAPESDGTLTGTRPSDSGDFIQVMGVAIGARSVFLNPSLTIIEHA